jgi:hypothetical protein
MKLSTAIALITISTVAAFNPTSSVSNAVRTKSPFVSRNQALVQPINIDGRKGNDQFVSFSFFQNFEFISKCQFG